MKWTERTNQSNVFCLPCYLCSSVLVGCVKRAMCHDSLYFVDVLLVAVSAIPPFESIPWLSYGCSPGVGLYRRPTWRRADVPLVAALAVILFTHCRNGVDVMCPPISGPVLVNGTPGACCGVSQWPNDSRQFLILINSLPTVFRRLCKIMKDDISLTYLFPSLRPYGNTAPAHDGFSLNLVFFENLSNFKFYSTLTRTAYVLHEDQCAFMITFRWILLIVRNVSEKVVWKIKTHILCSVTFSRKSCRLQDNVEKLCRRGQATVDRIRRKRFACWTTTSYRHTLRICNKVVPPPVSTPNTFQDLPQLRETADNTVRYI